MYYIYKKYLLIIFLFLISFYPLVGNNASFLRDDWGYISETSLVNLKSFIHIFINNYTSFMAARPGLAFLVSLIPQIVGVKPNIYLLINLSLFILNSLIIATLFGRLLRIKNKFLLFSMILLPVFSSTVIFSTVNLLMANIAILIFNIGLYSLINVKKNYIAIKYFFSTLCFIISLLTFEFSAPLLLLSIFLIIIQDNNSLHINKLLVIKNLKLLPLFTSLIIYLLYNKFICAHIIETFFQGNGCPVSKLKNFSIIFDPLVLAKVSYSFVMNVINSFLFLFSSFFYVTKNLKIILIPLFYIVSILLVKFFAKEKIVKKNNYNNKLKIYIIILALIAYLCLVLSAQEYSTIFGYDNRYYYISWILISLLVATLINSELKSHFIIFLLLLNFNCQINELSQNYKIQKIIISKVLTFDDDDKNKKTVLINVPFYNPIYNFSNLEIFGFEWDFSNALKYSKKKELNNKYHVININKLTTRDLIYDNDNIILDGYINITYNNLYYININNHNFKISKIKKINNAKDLSWEIDNLIKTEIMKRNPVINLNPINTRDFIKKYLTNLT